MQLKTLQKRGFTQSGVTVQPFRPGQELFFPNSTELLRQNPGHRWFFGSGNNFLSELSPEKLALASRFGVTHFVYAAPRNSAISQGWERKKFKPEEWLQLLIELDASTRSLHLSLVLLKVTQGSYVTQTVSCCATSHFCPKQAGQCA